LTFCGSWSNVGVERRQKMSKGNTDVSKPDNSLEINPCGCGGEGYRKTLECGGFGSPEKGAIACKKCGAQGPGLTTSWQDIIIAWNKANPQNGKIQRANVVKKQISRGFDTTEKEASINVLSAKNASTSYQT